MMFLGDGLFERIMIKLNKEIVYLFNLKGTRRYMTKFFKSMPSHLEQYNPDEVFFDDSNINKTYESGWEVVKTFDENGLLHSYNDVPSLSRRDDVAKEFQWHSHGELYREDNKPVYVSFINDNYYATYDEKGAHCFNDMPSIVQFYKAFSCRITWSEGANKHRENDLPAIIAWKKVISDINAARHITNESYYEHGKRHRKHGKPAEVNPNMPMWMVQGVLHNSNSFALSTNKNMSKRVIKTWSLYGVVMPEQFFNTIKTFNTSTNVPLNIPLWVAFLYRLKLIDMKTIRLFVNEENLWSPDVPIAWLIQALGLTDEMFVSRINFLKEKEGNIYFLSKNPISETSLDDFLNVIKSEEEDALALLEDENLKANSHV